MIIMINGAFGVGKTSVAEALNKRLSNSMLYDPEEVGYMLRNILTEKIMESAEDTDDFQDLKLWKTLTVEVAKQLILKYERDLIIPITIHDKDRFQYIYNGFRNLDQQTYHFCLLATEETIHERLLERGEKEGDWCFQQTKKCIEGYKDMAFEEFVETDGIDVSEIVTSIRKKMVLRTG